MTQGLFRPGNEVEIYQSQAWFLENLVLPLFKSWASISHVRLLSSCSLAGPAAMHSTPPPPPLCALPVRVCDVCCGEGPSSGGGGGGGVRWRGQHQKGNRASWSMDFWGSRGRGEGRGYPREVEFLGVVVAFEEGGSRASAVAAPTLPRSFFSLLLPPTPSPPHATTPLAHDDYVLISDDGSSRPDDTDTTYPFPDDEHLAEAPFSARGGGGGGGGSLSLGSLL